MTQSDENLSEAASLVGATSLPQRRGLRAAAATIGPGLLVMLADTDAGNIVTAAQAGVEWRYRLLPLILALIPLLYMVQELTVRLGVFTGRGHGELIRERFGAAWAWLSAASLLIAVIGSMITEFSAVAGIGELYGVSRGPSLTMSAGILLVIALTGSYRRVERIAVAIGLFELAFFAVAITARPDLRSLAGDAIRQPLGNAGFLYLAAAVIGATFNPWMVFYQQSAIAQKKLQAQDFDLARIDTAAGAILTQCLTGAVLIAAAATLGARGVESGLSSIGEISEALSPLLGETVGHWVFCLGALGAAMVAAVVSSLALAWGLGEVAGYRRSLDDRPLDAKWFYLCYAACVIGTAVLVKRAPDLVWLNVAAQVLNAFLMPLVIGLLIALAATSPPKARRLRSVRLVVVVAVSAAVCLIGVVGGVWGLIAP